MVQSAVPGGLGRLLLSSGCFCCCAGAGAAGVDCARAVAAIGCARTKAAIGCAKIKAAKMKTLSAIAEKCLLVMMNVLSRKDFIIAQPGRLWPAAGLWVSFEKLTH
jgi:trimethylamine:corrinoid methyltransferase-like protein